MNAQRDEKELSRWLDGELPAGRAARLDEAVKTSGELQEARAAFEGLGAMLREEAVPPGQTPEAAWSELRRRMRLAGDADGEAEPGMGIFGSRLRWAAAMVIVLFVGLSLWVGLQNPGASGLVTASDPADVEWVETEIENATTMVYRDEETDLTVIWLLEEEGPEGANADS